MAYNLRKLNILLIDDDSTMRALLRDILKAFDVGDVRTASGGARAYAELQNYHADIVIVDWLMKPMSGLEFLKRVRLSDDTPNPFVPTIMLTAYSDKRRVLASRDAGTTEFLIKPITPTRLYNRIAAVIEDNRCYVRSEGFFGPDRRRADRPYTGPERRDAASVVMIDL